MEYEVTATRRTSQHNYTNTCGGLKNAWRDLSKPKGGISVVRSWCAQRASRSSRFPGDVFSQRSREAAGYGHRNGEGSFMPPAYCAGCRVRFGPATTARLVACPECGESRQTARLEAIVGFRLIGREDSSRSLPVAVRCLAPGRTARIRE